MSKYKHIFFDLDGTLWDFDKNSLATLEEMFYSREIDRLASITFVEFLKYYKSYNKHLWDLYKQAAIEKEYLRNERFEGTLSHFGIENKELANQLADDYVTISPTKKELFPHTIHVLEELSKKYQLHIITNGFTEVQLIKIENSDLKKYFTQIITSEMVGVQKPNKQVFQYALDKAAAKAEESIMIGDDQESDIIGADNIGIDQIFVNFRNETKICNPKHEINNLLSLLELL